MIRACRTLAGILRRRMDGPAREASAAAARAAPDGAAARMLTVRMDARERRWDAMSLVKSGVKRKRGASGLPWRCYVLEHPPIHVRIMTGTRGNARHAAASGIQYWKHVPAPRVRAIHSQTAAPAATAAATGGPLHVPELPLVHATVTRARVNVKRAAAPGLQGRVNVPVIPLRVTRSQKAPPAAIAAATGSMNAPGPISLARLTPARRYATANGTATGAYAGVISASET